MDELIGVFPTPLLRAPGALPRGLVDALVAHFGGLAVQDNNASPKLSHTRMLRPGDSPHTYEPSPRQVAAIDGRVRGHGPFGPGL